MVVVVDLDVDFDGDHDGNVDARTSTLASQVAAAVAVKVHASKSTTKLARRRDLARLPGEHEVTIGQSLSAPFWIQLRTCSIFSAGSMLPGGIDVPHGWRFSSFWISKLLPGSLGLTRS